MATDHFADDNDVDVLVVGAGPVGLTAAILLARLGVRVAIVERRTGPQRAPAAHVVNARTFEIWRQAGVDVDALRALALSPDDGGFVHWVDKLGGEVIGSLPFERQGDDVLDLTPTPLRNLSQHRIEPALRDELARLGVHVAYGHRWRRGREHPDGYESIIESDGGEATVRSAWVLACDGAGSPLRSSVGIEPVGPHRIQEFLMVHFAADLRRVVGEHPGVLYWVCDPASGGTFVAHDIDREWVYMYPLADDADRSATTDHDASARLVRRALADPDVDFEILTVGTWVMTAQVADRYRAGRVLLVGDAAHRFPPTGGLGLNTGVADAHNLAWKLAAVLRGTDSDALLDSYEAERRPIAERNAAVSLENAMKLIEVPIALGAAPDAATSATNMAAVLSSSEGRASVAAAIAAQATHFDMLGLQLGYVYGADNDSVRTYRPAAVAGARLPHGWIERGEATQSTLDLVPLDRSVVIAGPRCALDADAMAPDTETLRVGHDFDDRGWWDALGLPADAALLVRPDQHIARRWA